jgi:hypothetical protein
MQHDGPVTRNESVQQRHAEARSRWDDESESCGQDGEEDEDAEADLEGRRAGWLSGTRHPEHGQNDGTGHEPAREVVRRHSVEPAVVEPSPIPQRTRGKRIDDEIHRGQEPGPGGNGRWCRQPQ